MNPKYANLEQNANVQTATCTTLHRQKRVGAMRQKIEAINFRLLNAATAATFNYYYKEITGGFIDVFALSRASECRLSSRLWALSSNVGPLAVEGLTEKRLSVRPGCWVSILGNRTLDNNLQPGNVSGCINLAHTHSNFETYGSATE